MFPPSYIRITYACFWLWLDINVIILNQTWSEAADYYLPVRSLLSISFMLGTLTPIPDLQYTPHQFFETICVYSGGKYTLGGGGGNYVYKQIYTSFVCTCTNTKSQENWDWELQKGYLSQQPFLWGFANDTSQTNTDRQTTRKQKTDKPGNLPLLTI